MELIRLMESEEALYPVTNEDEWHVVGAFDDFTGCGLAYLSTDRESESKRGRLKDVTCLQCRETVEYYKKLR